MKQWWLLLSLTLLPAVQAAPSWPVFLAVETTVPTANTQTDLLKGVFYYHYLNEDYQAAFNQLALLQQHMDASEQPTLDVLQTLLLLSLGMDAQAQRLFKQIELNNHSVSGQAWLYLARRWQEQANWDNLGESAQQALNQQADLTDDQYQEALYLLLSSDVEQDSIKRAQNTLARMEKTGRWTLLAYHNVLVGLVRNFASVYEIQSVVSEALLYAKNTDKDNALVDRIHLIAGIYMLQQGRNVDAQNYLARIRQNGPYSAEGLLQYGWAKLEQSKYFDALQPWRELQKNYVDWHPAVIESILAVPHTMELMSAYTQSLRNYEMVEEQLQQMRLDIQQQQQPAYQQQWLAKWAQQQQGQWGKPYQRMLFDQVELRQNFLGLTAQTQFRSQLSQYYDTLTAKHALEQHQEQLVLWAQAVSARQAHLKSVDGQRRLAQLQQRQHALLSQVEQLEQEWQGQEKSLFSYASAEQKHRLGQLDNVVEQIKYLQTLAMPSRNLNPYKERWRRTRGTLLWNMTRDLSAREWQTTSEFWQLHQAIAQLRVQLEHSEQSLQWSASSWQGLAPRIAQLQTRITQTLTQLDYLQQTQEQHIYAAMNDHLNTLDARFVHYQTQARLALARLYDDALQERLMDAQANSEVLP